MVSGSDPVTIRAKLKSALPHAPEKQLVRALCNLVTFTVSLIWMYNIAIDTIILLFLQVKQLNQLFRALTSLLSAAV